MGTLGIVWDPRHCLVGEPSGLPRECRALPYPSPCEPVGNLMRPCAEGEGARFRLVAPQDCALAIPAEPGPDQENRDGSCPYAIAGKMPVAQVRAMPNHQRNPMSRGKRYFQMTALANFSPLCPKLPIDNVSSVEGPARGARRKIRARDSPSRFSRGRRPVLAKEMDRTGARNDFCLRRPTLGPRKSGKVSGSPSVDGSCDRRTDGGATVAVAPH
jgi:hypothetical protein